MPNSIINQNKNNGTEEGFPCDNRRKKKSPLLLYRIAAVLFWLAVWQAAAMLLDSDILLVTPLAVIKVMARLLTTADFFTTAALSFAKIAAGFVAAAVTGTLLAAASAVSPVLKTLLFPITSVIKATPVASFIILAIIWFGSSWLSTAISFLMVFPLVYVSVLEGINNLDVKLGEMADVFGISFPKRVFYILIPQVMPFFVSSAKSALGLAFKSGIAAEVIGIPAGSIGERLYMAKLSLDTGELLAWTAVIVALSVICEKTVLFLLRRFPSDKN